MRGRPASSVSDTHRTPTFASRAPARPPSLPGRPAVSLGSAGAPVPSKAQHSFRPGFDASRASETPPPASVSVRHASRSSPAARVARSIRFAPKFSPDNSRSNSSACAQLLCEPARLASRHAVGVIDNSMSSSRSRGRQLRPHSRHPRRAISARTLPSAVSIRGSSTRTSRSRPPQVGHAPGAESSCPYAARSPSRAASSASERSRPSSSAAWLPPEPEHAISAVANRAIDARSSRRASSRASSRLRFPSNSLTVPVAIAGLLPLACFRNTMEWENPLWPSRHFPPALPCPRPPCLSGH